MRPHHRFLLTSALALSMFAAVALPARNADALLFNLKKLVQSAQQNFQKAFDNVKKISAHLIKDVKEEAKKAAKALRNELRKAGRELIEQAKKAVAPEAKQLLRPAFHAYIEANRLSFRHRATPLTAAEKAGLAAFFPRRILEKVRVLERDRDTGYFNKGAGATTFGDDFVIVRKGHRSLRLLKHELVHACQYERLGVQGFAHAYADQYVDGGFSYEKIPFEIQAYGYDRYRTPIASYLGYCHETTPAPAVVARPVLVPVKAPVPVKQAAPMRPNVLQQLMQQRPLGK